MPFFCLAYLNARIVKALRESPPRFNNLTNSVNTAVSQEISRRKVSLSPRILRYIKLYVKNFLTVQLVLRYILINEIQNLKKLVWLVSHEVHLNRFKVFYKNCL